MTTPTRHRPPGRYDEAKEASQPIRLAFGLAFGLLLTLAVVRLYDQYGNQDVRGSTRGYDVQSDSAVVVVFAVDRNDPEQAADCYLRARGASGATVGDATVRIPPGTAGQDRVQVQQTLVTSARAVAGEVVACRVAGQR